MIYIYMIYIYIDDMYTIYMICMCVCMYVWMYVCMWLTLLSLRRMHIWEKKVDLTIQQRDATDEHRKSWHFQMWDAHANNRN